MNIGTWIFWGVVALVVILWMVMSSDGRSGKDRRTTRRRTNRTAMPPGKERRFLPGRRLYARREHRPGEDAPA